MGLADCFSAEDRVNVRFTDFYNLVKGCTQKDMIYNAVKAKVPHEYIESMMNGKIFEKDDDEQ